MQYLKALVIGLGILILLCIGLLAYGLLTKTGTKKNADQIESAINPSRANTFGNVVLQGYPGCQIDDTIVSGHLLVLTLGGAEQQCHATIVVDMADGQVLGTVRLDTK